MAITYFRCTNLDENTAKLKLFVEGNDNPIGDTTVLKGETQIDFNLNELITEEGTYKLYVKAYPVENSTDYLESPASESIEYIISSSDDNESGEEDGSEEDNTNQYYTFTIIPDPDTATVTLTSTGYTQDGNSITVLNESKVYWKVEAEGYVSQSGEQTVTENTEHTVTLTLDTSTFPTANYTEIEPLIHESKAVNESDDEMTTNSNTNIYEFNNLPSPENNAGEVGILQILLSAPVVEEYYIKKDTTDSTDEYFFIKDLSLTDQNVGEIEFYNIDSDGIIEFYFHRILITVPKGVTVRGAWGKEGAI